MMNILMVLTSHDKLGDTGEKTGFWLEEFAAPYYALKDAGAHIVLASPKGGQPPVDPKSDAPESQTDDTRRFKGDNATQDALAKTEVLADIDYSKFDGVFYPGGHGPLWDLAEDKNSISLIEAFAMKDLPIAAVCHAPGVFRHTKDAKGTPLVSGRKVTGFANSEEEAAGLTKVVPFLVEDALTKNGGHYSKGADWAPHTVVDGNLITGQNPASSTGVAEALIDRIRAAKAA
ncbi:type 1 glutamine amidotransferase domain-containing protein [Sneathiella sp. CAU 1612]|uniref:Type 1 glutamine amidotransferase domain-containing protein n=2 Tax=Sneathiella sedimenti TaxID=2816034 RepID=A0ABS3F8Y5_9PROT|nr:type 1 glutamine amidotransferase domain-containing protein [Sneathiella sedimenti]MBO0334787.1 type 1 glutamine amidotransferase domain-containing protein [Sneathiella sedimenti]